MTTSNTRSRSSKQSSITFPTGQEFPRFVEGLRDSFVRVASKGRQGTCDPSVLSVYMHACKVVAALPSASEEDKRQMQCLLSLPATKTKPARQFTLNWKNLGEVLNNDAPLRSDILNAKAEFSL
jgi:hypothetical protein